jgi:hypothetical protein
MSDQVQITESSDRVEVAESKTPNTAPSSINVLVAVITVLVSLVAIGVFLWFAFVNTSLYPRVLPTVAHSIYPVGIPDKSEPSGKAPPGPNALKGYTLRYENDFTGTTIPTGWDAFDGTPGGDPDGQFGSAHVVVSGGLLRLNTWKDPAYGDKWVTGGICQCGLATKYGAYLVRSRITGAGPNEVQLLWPASNLWPPEIDFNESGGSNSATSSTLHYGTTNLLDQRQLSINLTQWHTWGVIWTPSTVKYIVNGQVWGSISVRTEIANVPMTLDMEQRDLCQIGLQCPTKPESMLIDWVAEYQPS